MRFWLDVSYFDYSRVVVNNFAFACRPTGSNKAMKLGSKGKDVDHFVDKLRSEGTGNIE